MAKDLNFKYDAFISYRHSEIDKFVAENLHKRLEAYVPPRNLDASLVTGERRIKRVFRDEEELPLATNLEDPIVMALSNSDWLIVICTPRLNQSEWCKKEIATFIQMHGRDRVLLALCEGEPDVSFPELMRYDEQRIPNYDGTYTIKRTPLEPLAADFRGDTKREILKKMDIEIFRLLARMYNVNFDDLRRRHHEREVRRRLIAASAVTGFSLITGIVGLGTAAYISNQNVLIGEQNAQLAEQQIQLVKNQSVSYAELAAFNADENPKEALRMAYASATEYDGIPMVYTQQAQRLMTNLLHLYDSSGIYKLNQVFNTDTNIDFVVTSATNQYFATVSNNGTCFIYNTNGSPVDAIRNVNVDDSVAFYEDKYLVCGVGDSYWGFDSIIVYDLENGSTNTYDISSSRLGTIDGKKLLYAWDMSKITFYDITTMQEVCSYNLENYSNDIISSTLKASGNIFAFTDGEIFTSTDEDGNYVEDTHALSCENTLYVVSIETGEILYSTRVDNFYNLKDITTIDDVTVLTLCNNGFNSTGSTIIALKEGIQPVTPEITPAITPEEIPDEEPIEEENEEAEVIDEEISDEETSEETTEEITEDVILPSTPSSPSYSWGELWRIWDDSAVVESVMTREEVTPGKLYFISKNTVRIRDAQTGDVSVSAVFDADIKCLRIAENKLTAFLEDGTCQVAVTNFGIDAMTVTWFHSEPGVKKVVVANGNIFVIPRFGSSIYTFSLTSSPDIEMLDSVPKDIDFFSIGESYTTFSKDEFESECEKYSLNTSLVYDINYSLDGKLAFANMNDGTVQLFDAQKSKLIGTFTNETGYYFTSVVENSDYYFIGSHSIGSYMIEKETLEIVADIDNLAGADDDYVYVSDMYYNPDYPDNDVVFGRIPIYSAESVLELAEEALDD